MDDDPCEVCGRPRPEVDWSIEFEATLCDPCYRARLAAKSTARHRAADRAASLLRMTTTRGA